MTAARRTPALQGTLDLLVLRTLSLGPRHGFGIAEHIERASRELVRVEEGSLYPALHRLEQKKLVSAAWKVSDNKQRVRVYTLTAKGKRQLTSERSRWAELSEAIARILKPARTAE